MPRHRSSNDNKGKREHVRALVRGKSEEDETASQVLETYVRFPRLSGGYLCLDFVNTIEPHVGKNPHDTLTTYADLVLWSHYVGLLSQETLMKGFTTQDENRRFQKRKRTRC